MITIQMGLICLNILWAYFGLLTLWMVFALLAMKPMYIVKKEIKSTALPKYVSNSGKNICCVSYIHDAITEVC